MREAKMGFGDEIPKQVWAAALTYSNGIRKMQFQSRLRSGLRLKRIESSKRN